MTLDHALAAVAAALWGGAYGWYFKSDIRRAMSGLAGRRERRSQQAAAARVAWARHLAQVRAPARASQARPRPGPLFAPAFIPDTPKPSRQPAARLEAKILPFPARGRDPAP